MAKVKLSDEERYIDFDPKSKSALISLEQLGHTILLEDTGGKLPKNSPIEHVRLIKDIITTAHKYSGYTVKEDKITVRENNMRRIQHKDKDKPCPIEKYVVERLVTKIEFADPLFVGDDNTEGNMAVGLSYTEKGIQLAFGHNVSVCQNLNIFGPYMWSTFGSGKQKVPFDKGMDLLVKWMKEYGEAKKYTVDKIGRLKEIPVTEGKRLEIIGKLFERAVRLNRGDSDARAPLNQNECAQMVAAGYDHLLKYTDRPVSAWDLTNWATSVLKPNKSDMVNILEANYHINEFMLAELDG